MHAIALFVLGLAAVSAYTPQRILGGSTTSINNYPSICALLWTSNWSTWVHDCGGIILNNRAVLTAAHCIGNNQVGRWRVRVGSSNSNSGGVVHLINRHILHPNYNMRTLDSDIAVIRTSNAIAHNNAVRPASIAGANYNLGDNQVVWAAGWGATSNGGPFSEQLRHVQIWTINQAVCNNRYGGIITANMLCSGWLDVGGRDQCQGDSGGPLYHNNVVVGVASFGTGCGLASHPSVNARVSRFSDWIRNNA